MRKGTAERRPLRRPSEVLGLTRETVAEKIGPILDRWPVERAWLYGSVARGKQGPRSDVDLSIELAEDGRMGLEVFHLQNELEDALHADVDVQTPPNRRMATRTFLEEYDRDRVLVYERVRQR